MSSSVPYVGAKISLISKSRIRYEGILYTIDPDKSQVALRNVRSFGTEDRRPEAPIAPSNEVWECIIFRGSDIQDLHVCEPPPAAAAPPQQPPVAQDPAIVSMPGGGFPSYAPNYPGAYPGYGYPYGPYAGYPYAPYQPAPQQMTVAQPPAAAAAAAAAVAAPIHPALAPAPAVAAAPSPVVATPLGQLSQPVAAASPVAADSHPAAAAAAAKSMTPSPKPAPTAGTRPASFASAVSGRSDSGSGRGTGSEVRDRRTPSTPPTPTAAPLTLTPAAAAAAAAVTTEPGPAEILQPFDFDASNALWDKVKESSPVAAQAEPARPAYVKSSFFDSISCESTSGPNARPPSLQQQRILDSETFGSSAVQDRVRNQRRSTTRGRGGRTRSRGRGGRAPNAAPQPPRPADQ